MSNSTNPKQGILCPVCGADDWDIELEADLATGDPLAKFTCNQCQNKLEIKWR